MESLSPEINTTYSSANSLTLVAFLLAPSPPIKALLSHSSLSSLAP